MILVSGTRLSEKMKSELGGLEFYNLHCFEASYNQPNDQRTVSQDSQRYNRTTTAFDEHAKVAADTPACHMPQCQT
jgi:hypothetical protein